MVFRIKFITDEVDGFIREIKIDSEATFLDLNKIILQSCGYKDDQMTSFYVCDDEWERGTQITREDMGFGAADDDVYVMEETPLSDFIEDEEQKLIFVFDPFADRCFYLDVKEIIPGTSLSEPEILRVKGKAPRQIEDIDYDLSDFSKAKKGKKSVEEEYDDFLQSAEGQFNADELDPEGFEFSDGPQY